MQRFWLKYFLFALLAAPSCVDSGGGNDDSASTSNGDDFESGEESSYVTASNLSDARPSCIPTRSLESKSSLLNCRLEVLTNGTYLPVGTKDEDVIVEWPEKPERRFGSYASVPSCLAADDGLIYQCEFQETNTAVDSIVVVNLSAGNTRLSLSEDVAFPNECDDTPATTLYNAFGSGTANDPFLFCYASQLAHYAQAVASASGGDKSNLLAAHLRLGRDLDKIGAAELIGTRNSYPFTGVLQGNGYKLSELEILNSTSGVTGMFKATDGATIDYFTIDTIDLSASLLLLRWSVRQRIPAFPASGLKLASLSGKTSAD